MLTFQTPVPDIRDIAQMLEVLLKKQAYKERFAIKRGQTIISVPVQDIAYFFSRDKISYIKTHDGKEYYLSMSLGEIEKCISPDAFFRATRQLIVSYAAITRINVWWNGKLKLDLRPEHPAAEIIISREKVAQFKAWLGE
ncbi:LytTR family DNA-binding domain-containing protein [Chitinophaga pollutisoli]|uniref:LytTR family DNA-binding domain-containing protein n=1 Tax=Chitinophaga pollutisoli TaxID=3133966 RepID=A0ABZ2YVF0_9BACT